jgi:hypothetical protein
MTHANERGDFALTGLASSTTIEALVASAPGHLAARHELLRGQPRSIDDITFTLEPGDSELTGRIRDVMGDTRDFKAIGAGSGIDKRS